MDIGQSIILVMLVILIIVTLFALWEYFSPTRPVVDDEQTPTDADERTHQLSDEIDRLHDENDALAAELVKERALMDRAAGALRAYIGTHGDSCSWSKECRSLASTKAILAEMDVEPGPRKPPAAGDVS